MFCRILERGLYGLFKFEPTLVLEIIIKIIPRSRAVKNRQFDSCIFFSFFPIECISSSPFFPKNISHITSIIGINITPISSSQVDELVRSWSFGSYVFLCSKNYSHTSYGTTKNHHREYMLSSSGESIVGNTTSQGRRLERIFMLLSHGQVAQTGFAIIIHWLFILPRIQAFCVILSVIESSGQPALVMLPGTRTQRSSSSCMVSPSLSPSSPSGQPWLLGGPYTSGHVSFLLIVPSLSVSRRSPQSVPSHQRIDQTSTW